MKRASVVLLSLALVAGIVAAFAASGAVASPPPGIPPSPHASPHPSPHVQSPVTKITFKLSPHEVVLGGSLNGSVLVQTRSGGAWVPFAGATLSVTAAGSPVTTLTTDATGKATFTYTPTAVSQGAMKVTFAGDATHKRAQRAQGFSVIAAPPSPSPSV